MRGIVHRYAERLPPLVSSDSACKAISLGEGSTPLIPLLNLPAAAGIGDIKLWVKYEGLNPTASFKDRGMAVAMAAAVASAINCVICASTGNTSASAAAYAARARMACLILIPAGKVAAGKIAQAVAHNAVIIQLDGNFDDAMTAVRTYSDSGQVAVVNSINPMRLQGQKTAAFEIIEELGYAPDYHALPVGNAGNITAHWIGYSEAAGQATAACGYCSGNCAYPVAIPGGEQPPIMLGTQATGAAPFIAGQPVKQPETVATAIRIGNPQSFEAAKTVLTESGGWINAVSDDEILQTQRQLAATEGIFCEPASAASVAGVIKNAREGHLRAGARVVCTLTGHGLKDPDLFPMPATELTAVADLPAVIERHISSRAE